MVATRTRSDFIRNCHLEKRDPLHRNTYFSILVALITKRYKIRYVAIKMQPYATRDNKETIIVVIYI